MVGRFDHNFMRTSRPHAVIHAVRRASWFALDSIKRIGMGQDAHLPWSILRNGEDGLLFVDCGPLERTRIALGRITVAHNYPTLRDRVSANFHSFFLAAAKRKRRSGAAV